MPHFLERYPGDTDVLNDWEFEYNGLIFGGAQEVGITYIEGLDRAESRVDETQKMQKHGSFVFSRYLDSRKITIQGDVFGDPADGTLASRETLLKSYFASLVADSPLRFKRAGDSVKRVWAQVTKLAIPHDQDYNLGHINFTVQMLAGDPRIYEDTSSNKQMQPYDGGTGVTFPLTFPFTFTGGNTGIITAYNSGNEDTDPFIRIYGPVVNPSMVKIETSEHVQVNITVADGDFLDIDFDNRTISLNDQASRYSSLSSDSTWWTLSPGNNTIQFIGDTIVVGKTKAILTWRGAWN